MLRILLLVLFLAGPAPALAQFAPAEVQVERQDDLFAVRASFSVRADPVSVWRVLTDYEKMPAFVPDLLSTRIVQREGNRLQLQQVGRTRWLFFRREIGLTVNVLETPMAAIAVNLVAGDLRHYECLWEFDLAEQGGTRIRYSGKLAPQFSVPEWIGNAMLRADIERMLGAVQRRLNEET